MKNEAGITVEQYGWR